MSASASHLDHPSSLAPASRRRIRRVVRASSTFAAIGALTLACSSSSNSGSGFETGKDGGTNASPGRDGSTGTFGGGTVDGSSGTEACVPNPANFDIPGNHCDDDGDGQIDNGPRCDDGLPATGDAMAFAKALGLCQMADATHWGVVSVGFTQTYGTASEKVDDRQHGILPKFGDVVKPREGASLGVLSSGFAREYDCDGCNGDTFKEGKRMGDAGKAPPGYPKPAKGCNVKTDVHDVVGVHLELKVPANAKGVAFDFDFLSGEWPEYVCTNFNDGFAAFLKSTAFNNGTPDNISFDKNGNPVSVNNGFFDRCTPNATVGCEGNRSTMACAGGEAELQGTGFYEKGDYCDKTSTAGGGTGWLTSQAPVAPGETIAVDFFIWDTADPIYDSSVLLDNLTWTAGPVTAGTDRPPPK